MNNFTEWHDVGVGDIIKKSDIDNIQNNLSWLAEIGIEHNPTEDDGEYGRCIAFYATVFATNNSSVFSTNNTPYDEQECSSIYARNFGENYASVLGRTGEMETWGPNATIPACSQFTCPSYKGNPEVDEEDWEEAEDPPSPHHPECVALNCGPYEVCNSFSYD